ncbi:redoxin domain-containing protein [Desertibacillus haloalkaliphilus]|uniref:redoxin domain-containing protein n=1 Tax=Desertibacillus haloalkaliphilus TaxID=1328930 RepID=UPI001C2588F0|nr:redoxin domain-containing protein [Desertibacillus haloalkaliphilus]MBU8908348.1 peroxiredoxin family protein [Desertibacillus haloalkaliphilus]
MCQAQLVELQENFHLLEDIDADIYAISVDSASNHLRLKEAGEFTFSFLSDPEFVVIEEADMRNESVSHRGFSIIDGNGEVVYSHINDFFGDQIEETVEIIKEQF